MGPVLELPLRRVEHFLSRLHMCTASRAAPATQRVSRTPWLRQVWGHTPGSLGLWKQRQEEKGAQGYLLLHREFKVSLSYGSYCLKKKTTHDYDNKNTSLVGLVKEGMQYLLTICI